MGERDRMLVLFWTHRRIAQIFSCELLEKSKKPQKSRCEGVSEAFSSVKIGSGWLYTPNRA